MRLTGAQIMKAVCKRRGLTPEEVTGPGRGYRLVCARHEIAYLMSKQGYPKTVIGRRLNRDHTTVHTYLNPDFRRQKYQRYLAKRGKGDGRTQAEPLPELERASSCGRPTLDGTEYFDRAAVDASTQREGEYT